MKIKLMGKIMLALTAIILVLGMISFATVSAAGTPALTLLSPSSGAPGANLTGVVINGTNLSGATSVTFSPSGVTASSLVVNGAGTQITANVAIAGGAVPGLRSVTVTTSSGTATLNYGFTVASPGAAVLSLSAPANVALGSGFWATVNITGANLLNADSLHLIFDPAMLQMAGLESSTGTPSGTIDGLIGSTTIPGFGWTYSPFAGTPSGDVLLGGHLSGIASASGSGYLAKIHFNVVGAAGSQTTLAVVGVDLADSQANDSFPANPVPATIAISANPAQVTTVVTNSATVVTGTTATLNGSLTSLGGASTVSLFLGYSTLPGGPYSMITGPVATTSSTLPLAFNAPITGLSPGTQYFYTAIAQVGSQTINGAELNLTTIGAVPTLISLNPNSGTQGTTLTGVVVNGTSLTGASALTFSGSGVTASNLAVVNSSQATATITVASSASVGSRSVTITTPSGTSTALAGGFNVVAAGTPVLTSLNPNSGVQGATLTGVVINGANLTGATAVSFSGSGVTASNLVVNNSNQITATITLASSAAVGSRSVTVTTPAGTSPALTGGFSVISITPALTSLVPNSGAQGATLTGVIINGINLAGASALTFSGGGDITASNLVVNGSGTQITATIVISGTATPGLRSVTVTATTGISAALADGFSVITSGAAAVTLSAPSNVAPGSGFWATINISGANLLNAYQLHLLFDPTVIQMAGLELTTGTTSGVIDGVINATNIPSFGWTFRPVAGTPSGDVLLGGHIPGTGSASGTGYLAKVHFNVIGAAGSQTNLALGGINLSDNSGNDSFPPAPAPVNVAVSSNSSQVTTVITNPATSVTGTTATLNGSLTSLGTATSVNLSLGYSTNKGGPYTLLAGPTANSSTTLPLTFNANITGLTTGTQYFAVAQAQSGSQIITGTEVSFTTPTPGGPPGVISLNPSSLAQGATQNVNINGTNLTGATAVNFTMSGSVNNPAGIVASNIVVVNSSQITVNLTISLNATVGLRDVTVTTPAGTSPALVGGFSVSSVGAATLNISAPVNVAPNSGFYATFNISGATQLNGYQLNFHFDPAVVQIAGLDSSNSVPSGISDGNINGVNVPLVGWTYQPTPGVPSGEARLIGHLSGISNTSGSGFLAKVHFNVTGPAGSQTNLSLSGIQLTDLNGNDTFPVSPLAITVTVSTNSNLVTAVTTNPATNVTANSSTLNGSLTSLGDQSPVNLSLGYSTLQGGPYTMVAGPTATANSSLPLAFNTNLTGLTAGTTYFYVAVAQFGSPTAQTVTGSEVTFFTGTGNQKPVLTSLSPNSGPQGATLNLVNISGSNLSGVTAVNFSGNGMTASNLNVVNPTLITATITISANATLGARNVTATSPAGTSDPLTAGFFVTGTGTTTVALDAPAFVAPNSGFYLTANITNAFLLNAYTLYIGFDPNVVQMAGLETGSSAGSGIVDGIVSGSTIPSFGWTYQPTPGTPGGLVKLGGHLSGVNSVSGSGNLARIYFKVVGANGSQTSISMTNVDLSDANGNDTFPANPAPINVVVSTDPAKVILLTSGTATVTATSATLSGTISSRDSASAVKLSIGYSTLKGGPYTLAAGPTVTTNTTLPVTFSVTITGLTPGTTYFWVVLAEYGGSITGSAINSVNQTGVQAFTGNQIVTGTENTFTTGNVGPATKLAFQTQPGGAVAGSPLNPQPVVAIQDAQGNLVTSDNATQVTLTISGSNPAVLSGTKTATAVNGLANFSGLSANQTGTYTLSASSSPSLTGTVSNSFIISSAPGAAAKLAFTTQPGGAVAGSPLNPQPVVAIQDAQGNLVTGDNTTTVTLAITGNVTALSGTTSVTATNGLATFSGLFINQPGTYTLSASSSPSLTGTVSNSFTVSAVLGPATKLAFTTQPLSTNTGIPFSPAPVVAIQDSSNNTVTSDNTTMVTLAVTGNLTQLSGTTSVKAINGLATFNGLFINLAGTYTLTATSNTSLTPAISNSLTISQASSGGGGGGGGGGYYPPSVTSTSITNGATGVPVNSAVKATFSMSMDSSTLTTSTFTLASGTATVAGSVTYDAASLTATLTPTANLSYSTTYTATITTGVRSSGGFYLPSNYIFTFTTAAAPTGPSGVIPTTPVATTPAATTPVATTPAATKPAATTPAATTPAVTATTQPATRPPTTTPAATASPAVTSAPPSTTTTGGGASNLWWIILLIILVVIIVALVIWWILRRRNKARK